MDVADRLSPVIGYRGWIFSKRHLLLGSPINRDDKQVHYRTGVWNPGEAFTARCGSQIKHLKAPPSDGCRCGVYALPTLKDAQGYFDNRQMFDGHTLLVGSVSMWGRVVEHEAGFRSQYAYPKTLYLPSDFDLDLATGMQSSYGVELAFLPEMIVPPVNLKSSMHPGFAKWLGVPVPTPAPLWYQKPTTSSESEGDEESDRT